MKQANESQPIYNQWIEFTNCTNPTDGTSTLDCLRAVPYQTLKNAVNMVPPLLSYQALSISFRPVVDGIMFKRTSRQSLAEGLYAKVRDPYIMVLAGLLIGTLKIPIIAGDVEDEGT